jgi:hypothetical protein
MTPNEEMVIFTRTFDFLSWLLPMTNNFPRAHRHTFTRRLLDTAFDLRECLEMANLRRDEARLAQLHLADEALSKVRVYLRLAVRWQWLSGGQYHHTGPTTPATATPWGCARRCWARHFPHLS